MGSEHLTFLPTLKKLSLSHEFKMVREDKSTWKANYFEKIVQLLDEYPKCFLVEADNVGSKQMQQIRISLRGHAVVLMGKNTMMRKAIRGHLTNNPKLESLMTTSRAMWALSSPRRTWSASGTSFWPTRSRPLLRLVPLPLLMSRSLPKTLVLVLRRLLSSKP